MEVPEKPQALRVNCKVFLSFYLVVPVIFIIIALDYFAYDGMIRRVLPFHPAQWPVFALFFVLPHICTSLFTIADHGYLAKYKYQFSIGLPLVMAGTYILHFVIGGYVALLVFIAFTTHHVLSQQAGLVRPMLKSAPVAVYETWRWMLILISFPLFIVGQNVGRDPGFLMDLSLRFDRSYVVGLMIVMGCVAVYSAIRLSRCAHSWVGVTYVWANMAMVLAGVLSQSLGYFMLAALIPRIIHDLTAFTVYITHDYNRNKAGPRGVVYKIFHFTKIPVFVLCPLIGVGVAYAIQHAHLFHPSLIFMGSGYVYLVLSYFHYYSERIIWKRGSPHREHVSFVS